MWQYCQLFLTVWHLAAFNRSTLAHSMKIDDMVVNDNVEKWFALGCDLFSFLMGRKGGDGGDQTPDVNRSVSRVDKI